MRMLASYITAVTLAVLLGTTVAPSIRAALDATTAQIVGVHHGR